MSTVERYVFLTMLLKTVVLAVVLVVVAISFSIF